MKKILFIVFCFVAVSVTAQDVIPAQPENTPPRPSKPPLRDRIFFGGNLGLSFGSLTYINISPMVGYRLTPKLGTGIGLTYAYYEDNRDPNYEYSTNTYGGRLFAQYSLLENVMAYAEYEMLNMEVPNLLYTDLVRENISSLFLGGGYAQPMGRNSAFTLMILFNVLESDYVIYENPIIRAGVNIGF